MADSVVSTARAPARAWLLAGVLSCAVVVAATLPSVPASIGWDNRVKLQVARSLIHGQGPVLAGPTPWDAAYVMVGKDGRRYTGYPPAAYVLQVPTIWVLQAGGQTAAIPALVCLGLAAWALVAWARRSGASRAAAIAGAFLATLGTALWPIAAYGYDSIIETATLALVLWAGTGEERRRAWVWAGLAVGASFATRLGAAVLAVPAAVLVVAQAPRGLRAVVRRGLAFALGCAPGVVLVLLFNWYRFGNPLTVHVRTALGTAEELVVPWFSRYHWEGMFGLTLSPGKGVLWYGPPLIAVVLLAVPLVRRHRAAFAAIGAYLIASVLLFGRLTFWHADWTYGPRYVSAVYVAVAPLAWWAWDRVRHRAVRARIAVAAAVVLCVAAQGFPVASRPHEIVQVAVLQPAARAGLIVTRPLVAPPVPADNHILYFRVDTSPLAVMVLYLAHALTDARGAPVRARLAWALLAPALAAGVLAALLRREHVGATGRAVAMG